MSWIRKITGLVHMMPNWTVHAMRARRSAEWKGTLTIAYGNCNVCMFSFYSLLTVVRLPFCAMNSRAPLRACMCRLCFMGFGRGPPHCKITRGCVTLDSNPSGRGASPWRGGRRHEGAPGPLSRFIFAAEFPPHVGHVLRTHRGGVVVQPSRVVPFFMFLCDLLPYVS